MSTTLSFLIRDGLESDIPACLQLDHDCETEHVWQMNLFEEIGQWQVSFRTERLPRAMTVKYPVDERRLKLATESEQCFLVAVDRESGVVIGYLTMHSLLPHRIALVQDLIVSRPYRGRHIGTRLLNVARVWAREQKLQRLTIETQTKNYPGIAFCQQAGLGFCGFNDRYFENEDIAVFFSQSLR